MSNRPLYTRALTPGRVLAWGVLILVLIVTLLPIATVLRTALTPSTDLYANSGSLLAGGWTLDNFARVLGLLDEAANAALGGSGANIDVLHALFNSALFTVAVVIGQVLFSAMAAYAFARLRFRGSQVVFGLFVASMMVPGIVLFIPNFVLVKDIGWLNTYAGLVAPFLLFSAFGIFFLRQFFLSIPKDLEEAALLDGASRLYIFFRIVLPLSKTPIATLSILCGIAAWNEFFWPFLVAKDEDMQVLTVALQTFKSSTPQGAPDWTGLMAATFLSILPTAALLISMARRVVESVAFSGGK